MGEFKIYPSNLVTKERTSPTWFSSASLASGKPWIELKKANKSINTRKVSFVLWPYFFIRISQSKTGRTYSRAGRTKDHTLTETNSKFCTMNQYVIDLQLVHKLGRIGCLLAWDLLYCTTYQVTTRQSDFRIQVSLESRHRDKNLFPNCSIAEITNPL